MPRRDPHGFHRIADELEREAPHFPSILEVGEIYEETTFVIGNFRVKCPATKENIESVAAKYRNGTRTLGALKRELPDNKFNRTPKPKPKRKTVFEKARAKQEPSNGK